MNNYKIPDTLNICIAMLQIICMLGVFYFAGKTESYWMVLLLSVIYGLVMNSGYALLHEAEHNLFNSNKSVNDMGGIIMGLFFPAPFHLLRQGHLGHHIRNRSDDEAFDFYFDDEYVLLKYLRVYGILTGLFWVLILLTNIIVVFAPGLLVKKNGKFDRPTEAVLESLNTKYASLIRIEAFVIIVFHVALNYLFNIPVVFHLCILFGFGFMWSTIQYVHHFGTERDVLRGAKNLKTFYILDKLLLNHNWHLNHHMHPTVPWNHLDKLNKNEKQQNFMSAYLIQWLGPKKADTKVENKYAGKIIR